jgi:hypothetical protein
LTGVCIIWSWYKIWISWTGPVHKAFFLNVYSQLCKSVTGNFKTTPITSLRTLALLRQTNSHKIRRRSYKFSPPSKLLRNLKDCCNALTTTMRGLTAQSPAFILSASSWETPMRYSCSNANYRRHRPTSTTSPLFKTS